MQEEVSPEWIEGGELSGDFALSYVPADHKGPCAMSYFDKEGRHWAIFPSREAAVTAAAGACRWDVGGYDDVSIYPVSAAAAGTKHYEGAIEFLFGEDFWDEPLEQAGVAAIVRHFMQELVRRIAAHPQELADVEWRDLERLLFEVFDALGYKSNLTRPTKDGAYDLRLEAEGHVYFVEVKHWSQPSKVGSGIIRRFTEIVAANGGEGLLLSSSGFSDRVVKGRLEVSQYSVALGDNLKIISLCRYYVQNEAGLWVREGTLRDIFFKDAF